MGKMTKFLDEILDIKRGITLRNEISSRDWKFVNNIN